MTFYVGQKVVAVDVPDRCAFNIPYTIKTGQIYTITSLLVDECSTSPNLRYGLTVAEVDPHPPYRGFSRAFFRPAVSRPTDISIFQKMLTDNQVDA